MQVATQCRVYVFVAANDGGVRDSRLADLLADPGVVKAVFGAEDCDAVAPLQQYVCVWGCVWVRSGPYLARPSERLALAGHTLSFWVQNVLDVQESWQAMGLPSVPWTYGLADLASSVATAKLEQDYSARNTFIEIEKVACRIFELDGIVPQMPAELMPRELN